MGELPGEMKPRGREIAPMELSLTVKGKCLRLTSHEVQEKLATLPAGPIRTHVVEVNGTLYPVKAAFAHVAGLDLLDFTTDQARSAFQRLGFTVRRVNE